MKKNISLALLALAVLAPLLIETAKLCYTFVVAY